MQVQELKSFYKYIRVKERHFYYHNYVIIRNTDMSICTNIEVYYNYLIIGNTNMRIKLFVQ